MYRALTQYQGDQIGKIFAYWAIVGQFVENYNCN
jgi:hypothetical protein